MTKTNQRVLFLALLFASAPMSASAVDRMHAGQWVGTTISGGRTFPTSSCISQSDSDAMNGDATAIQAYLEKIIPPSICKISGVKAQGSQVIYTAACGSAPSKIVTTSYHGDMSEGTDNTGAKTEAKRVGPCS
jgi:hypothetical protein